MAALACILANMREYEGKMPLPSKFDSQELIFVNRIPFTFTSANLLPQSTPLMKAAQLLFLRFIS